MRVPAWVFAVPIVCLPVVALAQDSLSPPPIDTTSAPPPPPPAAPAPIRAWRDAITMEGLIDTYYSFRPGGGHTEAAGFHVFDFPSDSIDVAYAELALGVKPEPVGLRLDLGFGQVADLTTSNPTAAPGNEIFKHLQQAYFSFVLPTSTPLTLDIGKFVTPAGAEVIEAKGNWNYSRSFLFGFAIPFTHTGLRLTAPLSSQLTLQAMLVNGWDLVIDNNAAKTLGLSLTYVTPVGATIIFNGLAGLENGAPNDEWRFLADLVVSHTVSGVSLMFNADYGHQNNFTWWGLAGYAKLTPNPHINVAVRAEVFGDPDNFRLAAVQASTVEEFTLTAGFPVASNGELRAEFRGDFANHDIYAVDGGAQSSQFQLLAAALVWF